MVNQTVPAISKIAVVEKANEISLEEGSTIGLFTVGRVGGAVLAINVLKGRSTGQTPVTRSNTTTAYVVPSTIS
jgi:hypothetical protein